MQPVFSAKIEEGKSAILAYCDKCKFVASARGYGSLAESLREHYIHAHSKE